MSFDLCHGSIVFVTEMTCTTSQTQNRFQFDDIV